MTIITDHINLDRFEDPGFWYLWANDFNNTFRSLFRQHTNFWKRKKYNINTDPPPPSHIVMWVIYAHALELYMKTYLLAKKEVSVQVLRSKTYSHDLERLRLKCAELDSKFNDINLTWITQDIRAFTNMDWEFIKYPPVIPPVIKKPKFKDLQRIPSMYGKEVMMPPLDLLGTLVKSLVYIKD